MPSIYRARSSLKGRRKLESYIGGSPTVLMLCFDRALLLWFKVVLMKGKNATKLWSSVHGGGALVSELKAQRIYCSL
jgi:hypothetical protein